MEPLAQLLAWQKQAVGHEKRAADMGVALRLLRHGIEAVAELEKLRAELAECRDALAKIGPYYVPSTKLSDDEVNTMYAMIDAARKGEGEV